MNFYKRHLGDIAKACGHLSQGQMGAYDLLLDWIYGNEKPLPASQESIYRIARAVTKQERANVDSVIVEFFTLTPEGYTQKRAEEEIAKANEQAETNRRIAEERESKRRARTEHEPCNESSNDSCTNRQPSQTPDSRHQTPEKEKKKIQPPASPVPPAGAGSKFLSVADLIADGVEAPVAEDWLKLRKAKRAPLTRTAWDGIKREAKKAGLTNAQTVRMATERGWQGFKAEWVTDKASGPISKPETVRCAVPDCDGPVTGRWGNRSLCKAHFGPEFSPSETGPPGVSAITQTLASSIGMK